MSRISQVIQDVMVTGFLSMDDEEKLRQWRRGKGNEADELSAFTRLQIALAEGQIRQESREQRWEQQPS